MEQTLPSSPTTIKTFCPYCFHTLGDGPQDYFCPSCGKKIKDTPVDTKIFKQISIYLISALLPPAGLWPAMKYLRMNDPKAKRIGIIAIIITIVSVLVSIYLLTGLVNSVNTQMNNQINNGILGY